MAKGSKRISTDEIAEVPISSLIDVVFLLIIFFVVTAAVDKEVEDEKVLLADAPHGIPQKEKLKNTVIINVHRDGVITMGMEEFAYINPATGQPDPAGQMEKVRSRLIGLINTEEAAGRNPELLNVIIRGDFQAQHGYIKQAMDAVVGTKVLYKVRLNGMIEE